MKPDIEELRKKYIENPPEGMTSRDIRHMSEEELLDMDYFLNDDELDDDFGEEGGRLLYLLIQGSSCRRAAPPVRAFFNSRERLGRSFL